MAIVEVQGLVKSYRSGAARVDVLRELDLAVDKGEMLAIVGASGVGKSTLLHVLGGLDTFDGGTVMVAGAPIHAMDDAARVAFRNQQVGFVFQFHHLLPEFSALENVEMPLRLGGVAPAERRSRAETLLARVGLAHRLSHRRARCRVVSSSASRWRARSSAGRRCFWPTSRPGTWMRPRPRICSRCCAKCIANTGSRRSSRRTT